MTTGKTRRRRGAGEAVSPKSRRRREPRRIIPPLPGANLPARDTPMASPEWLQFQSELDQAREELGYRRDWSGATECYFRGHRNESFALMPSLFRTPVPSNENPDEYRWQLEADFFYEFRARAREFHGQSVTAWDVLCAMQHYGVPTRLLDWTEVFSIALFFAFDGYQAGDTPCIWVMNPYALNEFSWGTDDLVAPKNLGWDERSGEYWEYDELLLEGYLDWDHPVALYPNKTNSRLHIQRASFTMHGDITVPLEAQLPKSNRILRKVPLPQGAIPDAIRFLRQAGIQRSQIYPELDGLALELRQKFGLHPGLV